MGQIDGQGKGPGPVALPCRSLPTSQNSLECAIPDLLTKQSPKLALGTEEPILISLFPTHKTLSKMWFRLGVYDLYAPTGLWEAGPARKQGGPEVSNGGWSGVDEGGFSYSFGLIQAHPVHPGSECLPLKSNQSAKPLVKLPLTPFCTNGDGTGSRKLLGSEVIGEHLGIFLFFSFFIASQNLGPSLSSLFRIPDILEVWNAMRQRPPHPKPTLIQSSHPSLTAQGSCCDFFLGHPTCSSTSSGKASCSGNTSARSQVSKRWNQDIKRTQTPRF